MDQVVGHQSLTAFGGCGWCSAAPSCVSDTVLRRFSNTLRFCSVLLAALLDSLTSWLRGLCQEHIDISTVLRIERCMLMQQARQVSQVRGGRVV